MSNILWNSNDAAAATGGKNTSNWVATGVSIDTRTLKTGDIFIAMSDSRDGHDFVVQAFKKGASAALVSHIPDNICSSKPLLIVEDVKLALRDLALFGRMRFTGKVIAITGSVGKTSSKDMLGTVLSHFGKISKAEKSFNNHIGVPLTLARIPPDSDFVIVEIGMSGKKEIAPLSDLVRPNIALITDVSEAHLASFKSVSEIAKEKSDICTGLQSDGYCIVSRDSNKYSSLLKYLKVFGVKIITFGQNKFSANKLTKTVIKNNKTCATVNLQNGIEFFFKVNSTGSHHAKNALGIICVLEVLAIDITQAIFRLSNWFPESGRGSVINIKCKRRFAARSFTIIDETYNANPASMAAAVNVLANFYVESNDTKSHCRVRRIAILGDMLELGFRASIKHAELADKLNFENIDIIHCIGLNMKFLYEKLPDSKKGKWVKTVKDFEGSVSELVKDKDIIMLKGSNGVGLYSLLEELKAMEESS